MIRKQIESQIRERIGVFVRELDALVRRSALDVLKDLLADDAVRAAPARPAREPGGAAAPAAGGDLAARVLALLQTSDGQTVSQIAAALGRSTDDVRKELRTLLAEGRIHTTGQRRGTRYHAGGGGAKEARRGRRKA
jgi:hypothetical protein